MDEVGKGFYNALRKLSNLETLSFGPDCDVSALQLCNLLSGKRKHRALKMVVLDNIVASEGTKGDIYDLDGISWEQKGWVVPEWTEKFPREMLKEVKRAAKDGEVELTGATLEAQAIKKAYREAKEEWADRLREVRWVANKRGLYPEEAWEILERRDERNAEWDSYDEEEYGSEEEEEEIDERGVVDSKIWLT